MIESFTDQVGLNHYALYVFDYGAPVGFRLAISRPERIKALISQNGNAYEEGLSEGWNPIRANWESQILRSLPQKATRWISTFSIVPAMTRSNSTSSAITRPTLLFTLAFRIT